MIFIIIEEEPAVTMTIGRSDSPVIFLHQLTSQVLQEMGQYAPGFSTSMVQVGEYEAVLVEGTPQTHPEIQLKDYYIIHDFKLYSILFSVSPKDQWPAYANLVDEIMTSLEFID